MLRQLSTLLALIMSSGLISIGHGAAAALVLQQGVEFGFSDTFLGLLLTVTYIGFVAGNYLFSWLLPRISYIRTFSVCAAMLTVVALLLPLLPDQIAWVLLRFGHGLFFSTTVIICESWLNSSVDNQYRGSVHSIYMSINYIAFGVSQYILLLGDNPAQGFSLVAIFLILSLAPICLTRFAEPQASGASGGGGVRMSVSDAYRIAPIAYIGQIGNGMLAGATWLFVRYAESVTDDTETASTLAVLFFGGGFVLQLPIGWLSDRVKDRRSVITLVYGVSGVIAFLLYFGAQFSPALLTALVLSFGMISATGFSLILSYGQSFAGRARASEYAGRLFQPFAIGAIIGPFVAGLLIDYISAAWLFGLLCVICATISVLAFTDRIMPRFVPVHKTVYQPVTTNYTPTVTEDVPLYNEHDIGPEIPDDVAEASEVDEEAAFIGPQPVASFIDDIDEGDNFIGPTMPLDDDELNDEDSAIWRK